MKVFQLLMQNTEKDEYLYRGTHGSTSLCSWKPKTQPTHSPPFFCQPKQLLNQFSAKTPNIPIFSSTACMSCVLLVHQKQGLRLYSLYVENILLTRPTSPIHPWVCVWVKPMWSVEIHSLPFILRQKRWAEWKGNWSAYWSCWEGP